MGNAHIGVRIHSFIHGTDVSELQTVDERVQM
jgi:hypothetical protein